AEHLRAAHHRDPAGRPVGHRRGRGVPVPVRYLRHAGGLPAGAPLRGGVPDPGDRGQRRRRDRRTLLGAARAGRPVRAAAARTGGLTLIMAMPNPGVEALDRMSQAFRGGELERLLDCFSDSESATFAGSEAGSIATGTEALRALLGSVLARDVRYSFSFPAPRCEPVGDSWWVLADGTGQQIDADGAVEEFPFRVTGLLTHERGAWRWMLLAGSEPA